MTVQELINQLNMIEDKNMIVVISSGSNYSATSSPDETLNSVFDDNSDLKVILKGDGIQVE